MTDTEERLKRRVQVDVQLSRYDVEMDQVGGDSEIDIPQVTPLTYAPKDREDLIHACGLPSDSIIKLKYDGSFIPWGLIQSSSLEQGHLLDIQVFRPHQTSKPKSSTRFLYSSHEQ